MKFVISMVDVNHEVKVSIMIFVRPHFKSLGNCRFTFNSISSDRADAAASILGDLAPCFNTGAAKKQRACVTLRTQ